MRQKCIYCNSSSIVKNGTRKRKVKTKQSFFCTSCEGQFIEPDGFERMRHAPEIIVRAVHQHEDGLSLSKVQNHLWQHDGVKVTRWTISQWEKKYALFLKSGAWRGNTKNLRKGSF